ncbi:hypothetical protein EZV62_023988 [Acer yangbiense]|uniref:peptidylprolyl isomerase n=1 Tax=Acer yangbiense TaxID=1000413 RepID=A0A5C7H393_9ROSI|nr:hypothetical protein EZV62_023988 [Acer yangbiense]
MSALMSSNRDPIHFIDNKYKKESFLEAYTLVIYGINGPSMWPKTNTKLSNVQSSKNKGVGQRKQDIYSLMRLHFLIMNGCLNIIVSIVDSPSGWFFRMKMSLFPWKVFDHEKSSAYYKSLMLEDVVREDHDHDHAEDCEDAMEEGVASIHQRKTRTRFIGSRNSDEPASKKQLFHGGDVETPKSKFKTLVPYTIPELYTSIAQLIKESEERMKSWITKEIGKIAPERKEKDLDEGRASSHKAVDDMVEDIISPLHNFADGEKVEKDLNKEVVEEVDNVIEKAEIEKVDDKEETENVVGEKVGLDNVVDEACGPAKQTINLDDFPSPCVNVLIPSASPPIEPMSLRDQFDLQCPITAENFRALCTREKGIGTVGKPLHYMGSTFHRVIPGYMVHGGDITQGNGTGGESIYGPSFTDENFVKKHIGPGILSMAKTSTLGNGSQFYICTTKTEWLDCKQVIFDEMVEGFDVLKAVDQIGSSSGLTSKTVMVIDCGQLC